MTTINEVAERAQVSKATVSRVFNNPELVKEETRAIVRAVAAELDYQPNIIARGLKSGTTCVVALVVPDVTNPMFGQFARGCGDKLAEANMALALYNSDEDYKKEQQIIEFIERQQSDGIILASRTADPLSLETPAYQTNIPCIYVERNPRRPRVDTIHIDNEAAARLAAEYLISQGHRKIGIVTGLMHTLTGGQLFAEFEKVLHLAGIPLPEKYIFKGNFKMDSGARAAQEILALEEPPSAVFISTDLTAYTVINELTKQGVQIPADLAVVGNVDLPMSKILNPPLTSVKYPLYEHGFRAAELLLERIKRPSRPARHILLEPQLIVRESA